MELMSEDRRNAWYAPQLACLYLNLEILSSSSDSSSFVFLFNSVIMGRWSLPRQSSSVYHVQFNHCKIRCNKRKIYSSCFIYETYLLQEWGRRACRFLKTSSTFEKNFPSVTAYVDLGVHRVWMTPWLKVSLVCNLLHVSHLKGFIFRWTLFIWQGRSSDMVQFLSHREQLRETRSKSNHCGVSCGGPGSISAHIILHILGRLHVARQELLSFFLSFFFFAEWKSSMGGHLSTSISVETSIIFPSDTVDTSICHVESSDLVSNLPGMT